MAQSARLLDYVESYSVGGFNKTKIYTELNTNFKIDDRVYIVGGNFDNYSLGLGAVPANPYAEFAMGYRVLALEETENWIVIDRDYDGTSVLASPTEEAFISKSYFRQGEFNGGSFNDGIFGNADDPSKCLFNNKQTVFGGSYITDAFITHCVWLNGVWHGGDWFSKTDGFEGNFQSIEAVLNTSGNVTTDELLGNDSNNFGFGYNIWVDGLWEDGHWRNGTWENGYWTNGEWDYGRFKGGTWEDGLKHDGRHTSINDRVNWLNGTHEAGEMRDCFWEDGLWENGSWKGANNFLVDSVAIPTTAPYDTGDNHFAIFLKDNDYLHIFQPGDEVLLSYFITSGEYYFLTFVVQDITISNEIIVREFNTITGAQTIINSDFTEARISNSRWRHGTWQDGTWDSGYRRAGFEIDSGTIDDTVVGQFVVELVDPYFWAGTIAAPDLGLEIGEQVLLTNFIDGVGNQIEDTLLTINGIVPGSPTTVQLTGVPASFQNSTIVAEPDEKNYLDNTIWETGKFNSGYWENGYFKDGEVHAKRNGSIDNGYTQWLQGQWAYKRYDPIFRTHSKWYGGRWTSGLFKNGEWFDGVWINGVWDNNFTFFPSTAALNYSAFWRNGIWRNGTWRLGQWDDGIWEDGQWLDGVIPITDNGLTFRYPDFTVIDGTQYLRFRFDGVLPFTSDPDIGDSIVLNNTETSPGGVPTVLTDSNSDTVTGTVYEIIDIEIDFGNSWFYVTVDSPQNYSGLIISFNYSADVTILKQSVNVHLDGEFLGGTWENGIFEDGIFDGATYWNDGIFNNGTFQNSVWNDGKFNDGIFQTSVWNDGEFYGGDFLGTTWNDGQFYDGFMTTTTWNDGEFYGGLVTNSTVNGGDFYGGEANTVTMNNGTLWDGHLFESSIMNNGTLNGAIFQNSTKNGGDVLDGIIKGTSIHNGGNFFGGEWIEGTWNDGTWDTEKIEANTFSYVSGGGTTSVSLLSSDGIDLITNGNFSSGFTSWTPDSEWSISSGAAEARILGVQFNTTYNTRVTQSSIPGLSNGFSYKVSFDIIANTHPYTGGFIVAPKNLLYIELEGGAGGTFFVPTTTVGSKEIYITPTGGVGALDFTIRASILKQGVVDQFITVDNIVVEKITSDVSGFSPGDEVWTSGLSKKVLIIDPLTTLNQKGVVSGAANGTLTIDFDGEYIIEKTNPTQESVYAAKGIWRNGSLYEGVMDGMIFKNGNLYHPDMTSSVVENGNAQYVTVSQVTGVGLDFQSVSGWSGSAQWAISSGSATCTPLTSGVNYDTIQTGILELSTLYRVTLTISSNSNYLEDFICIVMDSEEYYLGSAVPGKTYSILANSGSSADFTMRVRSKNFASATSSVKVTGLLIQKVKATSMTTQSTWINGTANGITFEDSQWLGGTLNMGNINNSVWENGVCNFGNFNNCTWKSGTFNDGSWTGDEAFDAIWENGIWNNGIMLKGEWLCGQFKGGVWEYGMFRDGAINGNSKFYGDAFIYGSLTTRQYPARIYRTNNLSLDQQLNTFKITQTGGTNLITVTASDDLESTYQYPSGSYDPTNWGTNQPSWVTNFRSSADWDLDEQKIILRDILDYHLNSDSNYSDTYDVDFVDSSSYTGADLSGDGMTTSANAQSEDFLMITKKSYENISLDKSGSSNITKSGGVIGRTGVHWLGGTYLGGGSTTKILVSGENPIYRGCGLNGGNIVLNFTDNLTGQIAALDKIYLYGTGQFNDSVATLTNKDGYYNVTSVLWTGTFFEVRTDAPGTGIAPGFALNIRVELWKNVNNTGQIYGVNQFGVSKNGRYLTYTFQPAILGAFENRDEVTISGITDPGVLNYIKNDTIYKIKDVNVNIVGGITTLTLDVKLNGTFSAVALESVTITRFRAPSGANNFCLGGGGPGTFPPGPVGPVGIF
jgi:hypothetical protein